MPIMSLAEAVEAHVRDGDSVAPGSGPQAVITDFGILQPLPGSQELALVARYPHVSVAAAVAATGWPLKVADEVALLAAPTPLELGALRALNERTRLAHSRPVKLPAQGTS